jgi:hypothetical protein
VAACTSRKSRVIFQRSHGAAAVIETRASYLLARKIPDDMERRGPWTPADARKIVKGFYKFSPYGDYCRDVHEEFRERDPGIPEWDAFIALLEGTDALEAVILED